MKVNIGLLIVPYGIETYVESYAMAFLNYF